MFGRLLNVPSQKTVLTRRMNRFIRRDKNTMEDRPLGKLMAPSNNLSLPSRVAAMLRCAGSCSKLPRLYKLIGTPGYT